MKSSIPVLILLTISQLTNAEARKPVLKLWYRQPAKEWMQSTPVGNGRLGAMIFGGINNDRIALNEITMWRVSLTLIRNYPAGKKNWLKYVNYSSMEKSRKAMIQLKNTCQENQILLEHICLSAT